MRHVKDNRQKALAILREQLFIKRKTEGNFSIHRANVFEKIGIWITDYIIRAENISNSLKEAGEVISNVLLITMVLKALLPNFKPFAIVITQKKKTLTFSEFKVCLRSYEDTEHVCYPSDESNNILQMKTTFKRAKYLFTLWL